jgi:enoyl-CoA hydratase/carnithine racemase
MMADKLTYWTITQEQGVAVARFANSPMGYFCAGAAGELGTLIEQWNDCDARAIIITGTDGRFITHYSVQELIDFGADQSAMEEIGTALSDSYHALLSGLSALPIPVIAAIDGDCMGGGFELAMWCDIRIAGTGDIRIGLPETRLGIMPGGSGTQKLATLIGAARAREMILLGSIVPPNEALRLGLVTMVADDPLVQAQRVAKQFCGMNPCALANIKQAMSEVCTPSKEGLAAEAGAFLDTMRAPQSIEMMQRYLDIAPSDRRRSIES